jgi:hypothetical protein
MATLAVSRSLIWTGEQQWGSLMLIRKQALTVLACCVLLTQACSPGGLNAPAEVPAAQPTIDPHQPVLTNPAPPDSAPDGLEGRYSFVRTGPVGTLKNNALTVSEYGSGFFFEWSDNVGLGIKHESSLAVAAGDSCGVAFYSVQPGNTMAGLWMGWNGELGTEFLVPNSAVEEGDLTGTYAIEGYNPDGSVYGGTATFAPLGSIYSVYWETGSGDSALDFAGIGFVRDERLAVAYGEDYCQVYHYRILPDDSLDGIIGYPDGGIGSEQVTKTYG